MTKLKLKPNVVCLYVCFEDYSPFAFRHFKLHFKFSHSTCINEERTSYDEWLSLNGNGKVQWFDLEACKLCQKSAGLKVKYYGQINRATCRVTMLRCGL